MTCDASQDGEVAGLEKYRLEMVEVEHEQKICGLEKLFEVLTAARLANLKRKFFH